MSLQDAINQLQTLAPKDAGHLIRHQDWNALIGALGQFGTTLSGHDQTLGELKGEVEKLWEQVTPVVQLAGELKALAILGSVVKKPNSPIISPANL